MTKDEAQELVMKNGFLLKDLPDEFKKDELIVLQAIQMGDKQQTSLGDEYYFNGKYELPFFYADDSLKNNREFVLKAVGLNGSSIEYANEEFKKDKKLFKTIFSSFHFDKKGEFKKNEKRMNVFSLLYIIIFYR